jgi:2-polyprenyl-3-methyl-5-hydroxy-6-metoxy-1,4-benzoquinol methylase
MRTVVQENGQSMNSKVITFVESSDIPNSALWVAEAKFGFRYVNEKILALKDHSNILEVGCGSGILLSVFSEMYPNHLFDGIEPFGDGFSSLKELNALVQESGVDISPCSYENYETDKKYDLIYCVNVFEHVENWRHFLEWVSEKLKDDGVFLVLCPNYSFPYESHFRIPVLGTKALTYQFFKRHIDKLEQDTQSFGLWASLNFVKKRDVKKFIRENRTVLNLDLSDETEIIDDIVSRVVEDEEFRKRQRFIGTIGLFLRKIGFLRFIKLAPNLIPYMKLSFRKRRADHPS